MLLPATASQSTINVEQVLSPPMSSSRQKTFEIFTFTWSGGGWWANQIQPLPQDPLNFTRVNRSREMTLSLTILQRARGSYEILRAEEIIITVFITPGLEFNELWGIKTKAFISTVHEIRRALMFLCRIKRSLIADIIFIFMILIKKHTDRAGLWINNWQRRGSKSSRFFFQTERLCCDYDFINWVSASVFCICHPQTSDKGK